MRMRKRPKDTKDRQIAVQEEADYRSQVYSRQTNEASCFLSNDSSIFSYSGTLQSPLRATFMFSHWSQTGCQEQVLAVQEKKLVSGLKRDLHTNGG